MQIQFVLSYFAIQSTFNMKQKEQYIDEIKAIRQMMEQSSRFLSLSGLSGVLIGIYALIGAYWVNHLIENNSVIQDNLVRQILILSIIVLVVSLITVIVLTYRKTISDGHKIWNKGTRLLVLNLAVPLLTGGVFNGILISRGLYEMVAATLLIFYGLALVNAAKYTRQEIYYMGLFQVVIGIIAALLPGYALLLWALGFGVIHVLYGTIMHYRYDRYYKTEKP